MLDDDSGINEKIENLLLIDLTLKNHDDYLLLISSYI